MKIAKFMKIFGSRMLEEGGGGGGCGEVCACHDTAKSKPRHSFNAFMVKFRCGLKKWKYLDLIPNEYS